MKKGMVIGAALLLSSVVSLSAQVKKTGKVISEFGLITDIHYTDKSDSDTRKYSVAMDKLDYFINQMNKEKPNFIVELGDMVDTLKPETDAVANLRKIESSYKSFNGPSYHVLGNHEFDNLTRSQFLGNTRASRTRRIVEAEQHLDPVVLPPVHEPLDVRVGGGR